MSTALASKSKSELMNGLQRARATLVNAKKETKNITRRGANTALSAGAGYGVGALRSKFGSGPNKELYIPGTEVQGDLAVGVIASLVGVAGMADEQSDLLCAFGGGVLAGHLAIQSFVHGAALGGG